jgi:hypothetical protein
MDPVLVLLVVVSPILFTIARTAFGPGVTVDDILQRTDLAWPRGVQEEEPVAWRFDRPAPARRRASRLGDTPAPDSRWPSATRRGSRLHV